jgi:hypothetical protein
MEELKVESCSVEKIKEQVMRSFDDASSRRLFNWGRAAALALPYDMMAGWLLKKGADGSKRLARTLTPPKSANKNDSSRIIVDRDQVFRRRTGYASGSF